MCKAAVFVSNTPRYNAKVVEVVDKEKRKINLSMKALVPNRNKLSLSEIAQEMNNLSTKVWAWGIPEMVQMSETLGEMEDISEIIPGPCVKSGAVAPEFQVLMSQTDIEGGFEIYARKGFQVQEARVMTALGRRDFKAMLQNATARVQQ